jgi:hypothetical protein
LAQWWLHLIFNEISLLRAKRRVASWVFLWPFFSNKSVRDIVSRTPPNPIIT